MFDGTLKFDTKIDESGYELGLDNLGSIAKKGLSAVTGMASSAVSALGSVVSSAVSGLVSFGQQAVQTGMDFQSAVSQIGATLGYTVDELNNPATEAYQNMELLTEKAEEMGAKTSFSAKQAAEGLNILAMSGYTAEESMQMIDSVLDMAAAGGLELASAASYVAGSMKGFTKEAGNFADTAEASKYYADMIAKGATLANTNVQQLGEAMSQASSSADAYAQNSVETGVALLRLAEQNTVGSAAATALAAAMKELYTPTAQAKTALDSLGVSAYDAATGAAKGFNQVVDELGTALSAMNDQERANMENIIFGEQGKNAFDKMLASSSETVQKFYNGLENSAGSAGEQAEAMLDNLSGDITKFGSALDGLKIKISDSFDMPFREIVQEATKYLSELTEITKNQGLEGLASALGGKIAEAFDFLSKYIPQASKIGIKLVNSLVSGLVKNIPSVIKTGSKVGIEIARNLMRSAPDFLKAGKTVLSELSKGLTENHSQIFTELRVIGGNLLNSLSDAISAGIPDLTGVILDVVNFVVEALTDSKNLAGIVGGSVQILTALADGLIQSAPILIEKVPEIVSHLEQALKDNAGLISESGQKILEKLGESLKNAKETLKEKAPEIMQNIIDTLENAPLAVASVADSVITAIADALGIKSEWETVKNAVKDSLKGIDIETVKLNLRIAFKGIPDKVRQEFEKTSETLQESADRLKTSFNNLKISIQNLGKSFQPLIDKLKEYFNSGEAGETAGTALETAISGISTAVSVAADAISRLLSGVMDFVAWSTGETDGAKAFQTAILGIVTAIGSFAGVLGIMTAVQHFATFLQFGLPVMLANLPNLLAGVSGAFSGLFGVIAANPVVALIAVLAGLVAMLVHVAQTSEEWQIGAQMIVDWMNEVKENWKIGIDEIGEWLGNLIQWFKDVGLGIGELADEFQQKLNDIQSFWEGFGEYMYDIIQDATQWGSDIIDNFMSGMHSKWNEWCNAWEDFGGFIYDMLHHSTPEKGLLKDDDKWMPDMMDNFSEGIRKGIPSVITQAETLTKNLSSVFSSPIEAGKAVLNGEISMPEIPEPENQKFKIDTSENYEITFETEDFPEIPEFQNPEIVFEVSELPEFQNPEISIGVPEPPEFGASEIAFQMSEFPEFENPEITFQMPDIPELYLSSPDVPEIQNPEINFSVPEISLNAPELPELETSEIAFDIPEIPEMQASEFSLETPKLPEIPPPVISLDAPEIPEFSLDSPEVPEIQNPEIYFSVPELPEFESQEILLDVPEIPKLENPEITLISPDIPELSLDSPEVPEIQNPEIFLDAPDIPELESPEILLDVPEIPKLENPEITLISPDIPELSLDSPEVPEISLDVPETPELSLNSPELPEMQAPEISLEVPEVPEIYFSSPEIPELESPEITLISPEMPAVPDVNVPELPEISPAEIGLKLVKLPSEAFTGPELPEIKNPEITLNSPEIPESIQILIDERALQALQNAELSVMQNSAKTSPVTEMINNHYHTINKSTVQNFPAEKKPSELTIYSTIEMNEQEFGSAVKKVILDENSMSGGWFI